MDNKKRVIIESAVRLFAEKGFNATSVQEISDQSQMSKGAFYLHFSSKDELLFSIFKFYADSIKEKLNAVLDENLPPRETFIRQVEVQFQETYANREMITMHFTERSMMAKESMKKLFLSQETARQEWLHERFTAMYGEGINPYFYDLAILFTGMIQSFHRLLIIGKVPLDLKQLSEMAVNRLDDMVQGVLKEQGVAILTKEAVDSVFEGFFKRIEPPEDQAMESLLRMKAGLADLELDEEKKSELAEAIDLIVAEIKSDEPKVFIIKGMLAHFKGIQQLNKYRRHIADLLNIDLI